MTNSSGGAVFSNAAELDAWIAEAQRPLVFTNGCFDILHRGHVSYLQKAAELGSGLIVALNSDASVRRLGKGEQRPINPLDDRMAVLAALACVDAVCYFDDDTPYELIMRCRPDHLVKGGDWPIDKIVGCKQVQSWGGTCHSIAFEFERSTTSIIKAIRS